MKSRLFLLAFNIENMLKINNLHASVDSTEILKGINLEINDGEVHAIMGPNGSGKSTLANVLMGNPVYEITKGNIEFNGEDVTEDPVDVRAMFLAFGIPRINTWCHDCKYVENSITKYRRNRVYRC